MYKIIIKYLVGLVQQLFHWDMLHINKDYMLYTFLAAILPLRNHCNTMRKIAAFVSLSVELQEGYLKIIKKYQIISIYLNNIN